MCAFVSGPRTASLRGNRDSVAVASLLVSFSCSRSLLGARPADMSACGCHVLALILPDSHPRHSFGFANTGLQKLE